MRPLLLACALAGCVDRREEQAVAAANAEQIALLNSEILRLSKETKRLTSINGQLEKAAEACSENSYVSEFRERVASKAALIAAFIHQAPESFVDQDGNLRDPAKLARDIRTRTIKEYGKDNAFAALISEFGSRVGASVYYGRLGNTAFE